MLEADGGDHRTTTKSRKEICRAEAQRVTCESNVLFVYECNTLAYKPEREGCQILCKIFGRDPVSGGERRSESRDIPAGRKLQ